MSEPYWEPFGGSPLPTRLAALGTANVITDANSAIESGWYIAGGGSSNIPTATEYYIEVIAYDATFIAQFAYNFYNNTSYMRRRTSGGWQAWVQIYPPALNVPSCNAYAYGVAMSAGGALVDLAINGTRWNDWSPGFQVGQAKIAFPTAGRYRATMDAYFAGQTGGVGLSQASLMFANAGGANTEEMKGGMAALNMGCTISHIYPCAAGDTVRMMAASGAGGAGGAIYAWLTVEKLS